MVRAVQVRAAGLVRTQSIRSLRAVLHPRDRLRLRSDAWLSDYRCRLADRLGIFLGQRDVLTPPAGLFQDPDRVDGSRNLREFVTIGEATVAWLIDQGLQPGNAVLEVGSGIGRMAIPLLRHLDGGSYVGLEIDRKKVDYSRATVGRAAANFTFHHADVFSRYYNPTGTLRGCDYVFPLGAASFDFVFLASVFTHMLPADMEHYVSEIARVMAPGATCVSSFWLTKTRVGTPLHRYTDVCEVYDTAEPEHGVLYLEDYVCDCFAARGLKIERLWRGSRYGGGDPEHNRGSEQDLVIATKADTNF
jgi:SAM-dependent methyltransferase